jgi:hypothetical protein
VLEHPRIEVRFGVVVEEVLGDEKVAGVRTSDGEVEVDAVLAYVGLRPNSEWFRAAARRAGPVRGRARPDGSRRPSGGDRGRGRRGGARRAPVPDREPDAGNRNRRRLRCPRS